MKDWITIKVKLDRDKNEVSRFQFNETTTDSNGKVLNETEFNEDGSVAVKRTYRYFSNDAVSEYVEFDPMNQLIERHIYLENEAGEIEKVVYEYGDGHKVIRQFSFTTLGLADRATLVDEGGSVLGYETFVFNESGDILERSDSDENDIETLKIINSYDENGNVSEERKFVKGELTEVTVFTYDASGNLTKKELRNDKEAIQVVDEYKYDNRGNQVYNVSFQNGTLVFENKCTYDQNDHLLTEELFEIDFWERRVIRHEKLLHLNKN